MRLNDTRHGDDIFCSALNLAHAIRAKIISPTEVANHFLNKINQLNPALNAIIWFDQERFLDDVRAAERLMTTGTLFPPFFGVPLPIKDLTEVIGDPVHHGSIYFRDKIGRYDATVVSQIKKAGFVLMGRTNSPEFGSMLMTENALFGATRNPWRSEHTPGGSSGGAAAAVASGMAPIAHGSDGGGSIRIPASCCGLIGLKASRGRVPKGPWITEVLHGISVDGCLSRTVADTAAFLDSIAFRDHNAWYGVEPPQQTFLQSLDKKIPRLRVAVTFEGPVDVPVDSEVKRALVKSATDLASLGHEVSEVKIDWGINAEDLLRDFTTLWSSAFGYMEFGENPNIEPFNQGLRALAGKTSSLEYVAAVGRLQMFSRKLVAQFGGTYDILLTPTLAIEPPKIGWLKATDDVWSVMKRACEMTPYTAWVNITGQPAISVPSIISQSGLPIGVQMVAPPFREDLLLGLARELEQLNNGWA